MTEELKQEPVAWEGYFHGAGSISSATMLTRHKATAEQWERDGADVTPLYSAASLSQLVKERDALMRERTSLIETKRSQLAALTSRAEAAERERDALREALAWFVDREATIKSKFSLYGPADTAEAMVDAFRRARSALNLNGGQNG